MLPRSKVRFSARSQRQGWVLHLSVSLSAIIAIAVLCAAVSAFAQTQPRSKSTNGGPVARGKYIVEGVARCGQCHTPGGNNGEGERSHWLQGAPVPWQPAKTDSNWPLTAPRIGGTPLPANDADMIKLLTTGIWTTGTYLRPPMPQFRMNRADAEAVVAYLKSVIPQQ